MTVPQITFWLTCIGSMCWLMCFWWMYRISSRQDAVLNELREQAKRIERLSKREHDLIQEVHPAVGEIKDGVNEMVESSRKGNDK
jgi:hypothetical protein